MPGRKIEPQNPEGIEHNGVTYYNSSDAARFIGIDRQKFTKNIAPQLQSFKLPGYVHEFFKKEHLAKFREAQPIPKEGES